MKISPPAHIGPGHDQPRLAVLLDADNVAAAVAGPLLAQIAGLGRATVKRAYGDWTTQAMSGWKKTLLAHSITPIQQFAYTTGKNATDSALIIDAMDLMYTGQFHGFCLVSSDSDYTRLAQRLREAGLTVYGFGERKTPEAFVAACDQFVYTEDLPAQPGKSGAQSAATLAPVEKAAKVKKVKGEQVKVAPPELPRDRLVEAIAQAVDATGWAELGAVGMGLRKGGLNFNPRQFGAKTLRELLQRDPAWLVVEQRRPTEGAVLRWMVRVVEVRE